MANTKIRRAVTAVLHRGDARLPFWFVLAGGRTAFKAVCIGGPKERLCWEQRQHLPLLLAFVEALLREPIVIHDRVLREGLRTILTQVADASLSN